MNLNIPCPVRTLALKASCQALLAAGLLACQSAQAQSSSELAATYGRGIHAYFDNQTSQAEEYFSRVIQAGTTDPRVYYFRAMTRMRTDRQQEAEEDMRIGAAYEASNPGDRHAIGKALEARAGNAPTVVGRLSPASPHGSSATAPAADPPAVRATGAARAGRSAPRNIGAFRATRGIYARLA